MVTCNSDLVLRTLSSYAPLLHGGFDPTYAVTPFIFIQTVAGKVRQNDDTKITRDLRSDSAHPAELRCPRTSKAHP